MPRVMLFYCYQINIKVALGMGCNTGKNINSHVDMAPLSPQTCLRFRIHVMNTSYGKLTGNWQNFYTTKVARKIPMELGRIGKKKPKTHKFRTCSPGRESKRKKEDCMGQTLTLGSM